MSKAIIKKRIGWISILLVIMSWFYFYDPFSNAVGAYPRISESDFYLYDFGFYRIDSETILTSLKRGETDVFLPEQRNVRDFVWGGPILYEPPIPWAQADFLLISNALNQNVWRDSLEDWNIYEMDFFGTCQEIPNGFRQGDFIYFKASFEKYGRIRYVVRFASILPEYLSIAWGGNAIFRHPLFGWKSIELNKVKISAENALRIADENGGREVRLKIQNRCYVSASLSPNNWSGWRVSIGKDFEIYIDPYTGEILR